jgi:two-component system cell cycle sensor histidine kinase/response regulator CckA
MDVREVERTLLIVDDEDGVIYAIRQTLEACSYHLLATTDPHRALAIIRSGQPIDLIIIDLFMPSLDGATLLKECRRVRGDLKAILTTGIASGMEARRWRARGEVVVTKPWRDTDFINTVKRSLGRVTPALSE